MKNLLLVLLILYPLLGFAQGYIFMKDGDTIQYISKEYKNQSYKVFIKEQKKPLKIHRSHIAEFADFPEYKLRIDKVDEFTGNIKRYTNFLKVGFSKPDLIGNLNFLVAWFGKIENPDQKKYLIKMRTPVSLGCCGANGNYIIIKFQNGETLKLDKDIAEIDCKRSAESIYVINESTLKILQQQPLDAIRFKQSEGYMDFKTMFPDCLIESLKLLEQ